MSSDSHASSSGPSSSGSKMKDFNQRFRDLHKLRQKARKENHEQVVEEDRRSKLPKNHESKKERDQWQVKELQDRKEAEDKGLDFERVRSLEMSADVTEKLEQKRKRKKNPDQGFASYEDMTLRQHTRLTAALDPDLESYKKMKECVGGEQFYPTADTLIHGNHYPTSSAMDRLVKDVHGQVKRREQYHRRRLYDPDAPIDYINEKNKKFNKKLDKYYGKYTEDIKDDLERGTAI
ncbi:hypothetical protein GCK72_009848 [Caenorhabditis remanei]|uniref:Pre-mRNA-splicing factor SYF2 n=1 Tax=Caenorhabditis remanei TaxID=31234 RepID=A0A6A5H559_CAERE|nr:hypothetical protein GCK72_009848 [Caenorhabditis remanei]KAF1761592.1 hypothetical protein GCK72_009848 [Caenorhabditis remanei]